MRTALFIPVVAIALAGCTDSIPMKNAQTGQIAECGPYAPTCGWVAIPRRNVKHSALRISSGKVMRGCLEVTDG
jgi:hypothetical protein